MGWSSVSMTACYAWGVGLYCAGSLAGHFGRCSISTCRTRQESNSPAVAQIPLRPGNMQPRWYRKMCAVPDPVRTRRVSPHISHPRCHHSRNDFPFPAQDPTPAQCLHKPCPPPYTHFLLQLIQMLQARQHNLFARLLDLPRQKHLVENRVDLSSIVVN